MHKKVRYTCSKRARCSVCQRRLSMKVSCTDKLLRCSNCKVPYIQRENGVFRAIKAKQIRRLRWLYKNDRLEFRNQLKHIDRYLLKPFRYETKKHIRERLMELWDNKPKEKPKKKKELSSREQVLQRMQTWREKIA